MKHRFCLIIRHIVLKDCHLVKKNAGDSFCRLISSALTEAYVDDICIHSREFETNLETLRQILNVCKKFNLKLNAKKCDFLKSEN